MPDPEPPAAASGADAFFAEVTAGDTRAVRARLDHDPALLTVRDGTGVRAALVALYAGHVALADELAARSGPLDVHEASAFDDNARLGQLLREDITRATAWSADGWQPLHLAAFFGRTQAARQLLDDDAPVDAPSHNGLGATALHSAAAGAHAELVWLLIASGADVNARQAGGWVPLHAAAANGDEPSLTALLSAGAIRDARNDTGRTPLDVAAEDVRALLE